LEPHGEEEHLYVSGLLELGRVLRGGVVEVHTMRAVSAVDKNGNHLALRGGKRSVSPRVLNSVSENDVEGLQI